MYYVSSPYFNGKVRAFNDRKDADAFAVRRSAKIATAQNKSRFEIELSMNIDWRDDMNIGSGGAYPSNALSNFAPHPFQLDGVPINSMEGFLQSLKTKNPDMQKYICTLVGIKAKRAGQSKNWQDTQTLYWQGRAYARDSDDYTALITRAYDALFQNVKFRKALKATGTATLLHSVGSRKKQDTVLTKQEFISNLTRLRAKL